MCKSRFTHRIKEEVVLETRENECSENPFPEKMADLLKSYRQNSSNLS